MKTLYSRSLMIAMVVHQAQAANLLVNGDFNALPILGVGQTEGSLNEFKQTQPNPLGVNYARDISGVVGWNYRTPETYGSDSGTLLTDRFGTPGGARMAFIENWGRMMSQTVNPGTVAGETATARIQFGTLGSDSDPGRAGTFFLVAGSVDPFNADQFAPGSIILDQIVAGNPSWNAQTPPRDPQAQVLVVNQSLLNLELSHNFTPGDPALGMPLTVAFRAEWRSYGPTVWENASLTLASTVPEPGFYASVTGLVLLGFGGWRRRIG